MRVVSVVCKLILSSINLLLFAVLFCKYLSILHSPIFSGVFKILDSAYVASLWGSRKNNGRMTYDKFSRSIRQYYKRGIIVKTKASKLIYKFGSEFFNPNGE